MEEYNQPNKKWDYGFVYVLDFGDGKRFKIGKTKYEPEGRLSSIRAGIRGSVVMPDFQVVMTSSIFTSSYYVEQLLHMQFDDKHYGGEWFNLDFVDLVEVYQALYAFGSVDLYDRWFGLVPEDAKEYVSHVAISPIPLPSFTRKEQERRQQVPSFT